MASFFESLLSSPHTTQPTRDAIQSRQEKQPEAPQFFSQSEWKTFAVLCDRLTDSDLGEILVSVIDNRLQNGLGNGWRFASLPTDQEAYRIFVAALQNAGFDAASDDEKEALITRSKTGELGGLPESWDASRFFGDLLAEVMENFVAHPQTLERIRFAGFADRPGWTQIELRERHEREPLLENETPSNIALSADDEAERGETEWKFIAPDEIPAMKRYDESEEVDAVVIGTGAGGAPLLARLAQRGLKVVALEAGKWHDPRGFATDERSQNFLFWLDERLSAGKNPVAFGANNSGIGVGGSTIHYTAYTPRALPEDFQIRRDFGLGFDWPFSYADLEPYYDEVEAFIGVSGPNPYPWGPPRKNGFPLAPLPVNAAGQIMKRGCDALGIQTSPAPNAALSAPYFTPGIGWRAACSNRGFCQAGCSTGAKSSIDVTYIPLAVNHGAEIRPESFVTQIEVSGDKVVAVVYKDAEGREHRQKTKALFLSAGAIETPRLLLLNEIGNDSGQVGKNFMAHPGLQVWATFDEPTRPYKGIPGALISQDTHRPKEADFVGGYLLQSIGVMPVTYASQFARGTQRFGRDAREHLEQYNRVAGINILGDCLPYEYNFLELSDELDGRGLPKPKLHFTEGENERKMNAHADRVMSAIFEAAGARDVWKFNRHAHVIGTAMMGTNPQTSVVDPFGRSHEISNLWISDNSTFPSALDVNPALTIMAMALRTADAFLASANQTA